MPQRELAPLEMIGLLSNDPAISRAVTAGRPAKGGARKSIGQGFFYNPETDEVERDPNYAKWEKERRAEDLLREQERYQRGLDKPDYYAQETPEGLTVHDINPRNAPNPRQYPMEPDRPAPKEASEAFKFERTSEEMQKLKENMPPGVGDLSNEFWMSVGETIAPEAMEPIVRNIMLDWFYDEGEQNTIRELSRNFATTVRQFAGAAQTKSEKANVEKFFPHPGQTNRQLLDAMTGFIQYLNTEAAAIRDPYNRAAPAQEPTVVPTPAPTSNVAEQGTDQLRQELEELRQNQGGL